VEAAETQLFNQRKKCDESHPYEMETGMKIKFVAGLAVAIGCAVAGVMLVRHQAALIVNRLALIEQLAPESMDDVNAAAFAEAYKDLVDMYRRLTGS
jgi:divalent metal cation (Fe/Co/Zn/Cd) transporter